jgi:hypothetical protein
MKEDLHFSTTVIGLYLICKIAGINSKEMEELHDDIAMHLGLDRECQVNVKFWEVHVQLELYT